MKYYSGNRLRTMHDINGKLPEIYVASGNRSSGKTTDFNRYVLNRFIRHGEKFMLLVRYKYELQNIDDAFFKDIHGLFFPDGEFTCEPIAAGLAKELFYNGDSCGYACPINSADKLKKYSHLFSDTACMLFDEFQTETNTYCPNEIIKFQSLHMSVARGNGKQSRYVPVYMLSNYGTVINPYYLAWGISDRLTPETKFLRGDGIVVEQNLNEEAAKAQSESAFNRAFSGSKYQAASNTVEYLHDSSTFIERLSGRSRYIATLAIDGEKYALRDYIEAELVHLSDDIDESCKTLLAITAADHTATSVYANRSMQVMEFMAGRYEVGQLRFKNQKCKAAFFKMLTYR